MSDDVTVVDVLDRALELLEQGWCQGDAAIDAYGYAVSTLSPAATSFCVSGAIWRALGELDAHEIRVDRFDDVLRAVAGTVAVQLPPRLRGVRDAVVDYNDHPSTTQEDVILLVKRAREAVTGR